MSIEDFINELTVKQHTLVAEGSKSTQLYKEISFAVKVLTEYASMYNPKVSISISNDQMGPVLHLIAEASFKANYAGTDGEESWWSEEIRPFFSIR